MNQSEPQAEKVINDIVDRLSVSYRPERIVLFGSFAYGQPTKDSDIDLLIIKETGERPIDRRVAVRRLAHDPRRRIPFSPLVLTPQEVRQRLDAGDPFIRDILTRGETLYARS